jgi:arsenate reductase
MITFILWHNPRCGKSRQALEILRGKGIEPKIRLYLQDPPDTEEIKMLLKKLGLSAREITRTKESVFNSLIDPANTAEAQWINTLAQHPILIERPILITDHAAVIGRPPENILKLLPASTHINKKSR